MLASVVGLSIAHKSTLGELVGSLHAWSSFGFLWGLSFGLGGVMVAQGVAVSRV